MATNILGDFLQDPSPTAYSGVPAVPNVAQGISPYEPSDMFDVYDGLHTQTPQSEMPYDIVPQQSTIPRIDRLGEQPGRAYQPQQTLNNYDRWFLSPSVQIGLAMASPTGNPAAAAAAANAGLKARAEIAALNNPKAINTLPERKFAFEQQKNEYAMQQDALALQEAERQRLSDQKIAQDERNYDRSQDARERTEYTYKAEDSLRNEISSLPVTESVNDANKGIEFIRANGLDKPGAQISGSVMQGLLILWNKNLDPTSIVSTSESKQLGKESLAYLNRAKQELQKVMHDNSLLSPKQTQEFINLLAETYRIRNRNYNQTLRGYTPIVEGRGLSWDAVDPYRGRYDKTFSGDIDRQPTDSFIGVSRDTEIANRLADQQSRNNTGEAPTFWQKGVNLLNDFASGVGTGNTSDYVENLANPGSVTTQETTSDSVNLGTIP